MPVLFVGAALAIEPCAQVADLFQKSENSNCMLNCLLLGCPTDYCSYFPRVGGTGSSVLAVCPD